MQLLKRIFLFLLIVEISVPAEAAHLFAGVPEFIAHYEHHNKEHHSVSFIAFIGEHFSTGNDQHEDKQHPEDHCPMSHNHSTITLLTFLPEEHNVNIHLAHIEVARKKHVIHPDFPIADYPGSIWQPPQV